MKKLLNEELNRLTINEFKLARKYPVIVVLDNIRSLHNIGSIFRTCDAFLIEAIYLCGITATPPHREINKTALGATETVHWEYYDKTNDAVHVLRKRKYRIFAIEQTDTSTPLNKIRIDKNSRYALIFGHEIKGVEQSVVDLCDKSIEIPQLGTKHSINIAVSAGIVLWEFFRVYLKKSV